MSRIAEIKNIESKNDRLAAVNEVAIHEMNQAELQELIGLLSDPYWPIREAAAKKLISLGSQVLQHLAGAISATNEDIRFWSAQILSAIADERAINMLIESFASYEESDINIYSAKALVKIGDFAVKPLTAALSSPNDLVRLYSVQCLGELKATESVVKIEELLGSDSNFAVRRNAAIALGRIASPTSVEPLIQAISDNSWNVRVAATEALGFYKNFIEASDSPKNVPAGQSEDFSKLQDKITNTLLASLSDTEARVREAGAKILSNFDNKFIEEPLLRLLESSVSDGEKVIAIRSLGRMRSRPAVSTLEELLGSDITSDLKKEVLSALGQIGSDSSMPLLLSAISGQASDVAICAVCAFIESRSPMVAAELSNILGDSREEVRAAVVTALGHAVYLDSRHYLYTALEDSSYMVRRQALISLYSILGDEILSDVVSMMADPEEIVASEAISIAAKIKSPDAITMLAKVIDRGSNRLSYMAFQALTAIGPESEYAILQYLSSDNRDVCYWAINALEKIGSDACVEPLISVIRNHPGQEEIVDRSLAVLSQFDFHIDEKFFVEILGSMKNSQAKVIEILGKSQNRDLAIDICPYLSSADRDVRFQAASALGRLKNSDDRVVDALIGALRDRHWPVRKASAESLAALGGKATACLIKTLDLQDVNADTAYWSLRALAEAGSAEALPAFGKHIGGANADLKKIIIKGLGKISNSESLESLIKLLYDADSEIRFHAVKALKDSREKQVLPHLLEKMKDSYENVRSFAAIALGNFKCDESVAALKAALTDESHWVIKYARESLSKLSK